MALEVFHKEAVAIARINAETILEELLQELPIWLSNFRIVAEEMRSELEDVETLAEGYRAIRKANSLRGRATMKVREDAIQKLKRQVDELPLEMDDPRADIYNMIADLDSRNTITEINHLFDMAKEYIAVNLIKALPSDKDDGEDGGESVLIKK